MIRAKECAKLTHLVISDIFYNICFTQTVTKYFILSD